MTTTRDYVLGRTSHEYRRLRTQSKLWEPATARLLDDAGVRTGMRCLDVGCGPGEVMRLLAERVGESGSVTGVDVDGAIGREAIGVLRATVAAPVEFVEGDVDELDLPGFDVVYMRLVLMHHSDPVALLRRLWGWVAPGGLLVVQDYDTAGLAASPQLPCWDEFVRVMDGVFEHTGGDPRCGLHLPRNFVDAGIGPPEGTDVSGVLAPIADTSGFARPRTPARCRPRSGSASPPRRTATLASPSSTRRPPTTYVRLPTLVGAYKRKSG